MSEDNKPIGWWLKHLDALIEESFARALAAEDVGRRHWQLLNVVTSGDGGTDLTAVRTALAPFWPAADARDAEIAALLDDLAGRGWLTVEGEVVTPTPEGVVARSRIAEVVGESRRRSTAGIAPAEYALVVDTLRRMAANLAHQD